MVASVPITPDPVTSGGNEPDFVNGAWLYLDLDKGSLTHWDNQNNQWVDWSKIAKPNLIGISSSTSVSEKYQGMEFSKAVESIMNSSKSDEEKKEGMQVFGSIEEAEKNLRPEEQIFVIGGGEIYAQTIAKCREIYVTEVLQSVKDGDAFFPSIEEDFKVEEILDENEDFILRRWISKL